MDKTGITSAKNPAEGDEMVAFDFASKMVEVTGRVNDALEGLYSRTLAELRASSTESLKKTTDAIEKLERWFEAVVAQDFDGAEYWSPVSVGVSSFSSN